MKRLLFIIAILALLIPETSREQTVVVTYPGAPPAQACTSELSEWSAVNGSNGSRWFCNGSTWSPLDPTIPSGMIAFVDTGSCPSGWIELTHAGDYMLLTQAANGDVGTTGGSTSYTPSGSLSMNAITSVINHTHTVTVTYQAQGGTTASTTGTHSMTSTATGGSARTLTSGDVVSATTANPSGGVASITPTGSFSGTPATIQPSYLKLIACKKN